jgi:hypothetical protein
MAYTVTPNLPLNMPTPGTREPAQIALLNDNCVVLSNHDHTTGKALAVGRLRSGLNANRPAAGTAGNVYFATDTGNFYVDTGTAWVQFITSGGQATVSGWTLIDPIVRDTIQWGPEGSGTIDSILTRTAAGTFRLAGSTDGAVLGVGPDPGAWDRVTWDVVRFGEQGALWSQRAGAQTFLTQNIRHPGAAESAIVGGQVQWRFGFLGAEARLQYGASVTNAGDPITMVNRLIVSPVGTFTVTPDAGQPGLVVGGSAVAAYAAFGGQTMTGWNQALCAITVGGHGAVMSNAVAETGDPASTTVAVMHNGKYVAAGIAPLAAGRVGLIQVGQNGVLRYYNSASGTPGTAVSMVERLAISAVGTVTYNPDAGQPCMVTPNGTTALIFGYGHIRSVGATPYIDGQPGGYLMLGAGSGGSGNALTVSPANHNATHLGWGDRGWALVHSVGGVVQDSLASDKQNFAPLDPTACVQAVLDTDWLSFEYKPPEGQTPPERSEGVSDEEWSETQARYEQAMADAALARKQRGYALGSDEYRVADLFGMADRKSAGTQSDLATVACALQDALRRLAALEAKNGNAAAA